ncbi:MAG: hypothetical protein ABSH28_10085 [Acidobacteriota bacterium]
MSSADFIKGSSIASIGTRWRSPGITPALKRSRRKPLRDSCATASRRTRSSALKLALPAAGKAQGTTGSVLIGAKGPADGAAAKSVLLLNREPIPYLDLKIEVIEILPGSTNVLSSWPPPGKTDLPERFPGGMRVGSNSLIGLRLDSGGYVNIGTDLLQLDKDGIVLAVNVKGDGGIVLASQKLSLRNYEEAIVELATATSGNKKLAVRFLPTVKEIEPLQDYPSLVSRFGTMKGLLIRNSKEIISRGGTSGTVEDLNGTKQQFNTLENSRSGLLVISYRPFPGAVVAGYSIDKELKFEWNGNFYEWISLDKPFLPKGRWAVYVWQAGPSTRETVSFGGFEADPKEIPDFLSRMANAKQGIGGVKK